MRCAGCGSLILAGGLEINNWRVCDDSCVDKFYAKVAEELLDDEAKREALGNVFNADCPVCGGEGPLTYYTASRSTGRGWNMEVENHEQFCCHKCGRALCKDAFSYNLRWAWWSRWFVGVLLISLPIDIIRIMKTKNPPKQPSKRLRISVLSEIGKTMAEHLPPNWKPDRRRR